MLLFGCLQYTISLISFGGILYLPPILISLPDRILAAEFGLPPADEPPPALNFTPPPPAISSGVAALLATDRCCSQARWVSRQSCSNRRKLPPAGLSNELEGCAFVLTLTAFHGRRSDGDDAEEGVGVGKAWWVCIIGRWSCLLVT